MEQVLIACEYSGIVRDAFIAAGHDAISCDLLPTERPGPHIQGDVREVLQRPWDLVIAHPPCTYLTNARALPSDDDDEVTSALELFVDCQNANAPLVAVENPVMFKVFRTIVGEPDCLVDPFQFGDVYRKRTCWWLKALPPLFPTCYATSAKGSVGSWVQTGSGSRSNRAMRRENDRGALRAKNHAQFWPGMAAAMAKQWGCFLQA